MSLPSLIRRPTLRTALGLLSLFAPMGLARSQAEPPHNYKGFASQYAWNPTLGAGEPFKNVLAGRYTNDVLLDIVVQKGGQLVFLSDPSQEYFYGSFGNETLDAVRWPQDPLIRTDRLIASELGQIAVYGWDDSGAPEPGMPIPGLAPAALGLDLAVDPVGGATFLGMLHADGQTITYGELSFGGCAGGCFSPVLSLALGEPVVEWELFQWDGLAGLELLVHTTTEFRVIDSTGLDLTAPLAAQDVKSILGRFFDPALGVDRGLWYAELNPIPEFIGIVFDNRYPDLEPPISFGTLDTGHFGFMDYNSDGRLDVWFPTETTGQAILLYGQNSPTFPFEQSFGLDLEQSTLFELGGDPASGIANTLSSIGDTGDFDLDGDTDFFFVSDDHQHLNFVRGDVNSEDLYGPSLRSFSFTETGGEGGGSPEYEFTLRWESPSQRIRACRTDRRS